MFLIPDAFKHVRLQNTLNRCKVYQILPLMVDYACFLVKCINYQKVICIQKIYFMQDLARFLQVRKILQDSCDRAQFLARTLQNTIASKNVARIEYFVRILRDFLNLRKSCKILQELKFLSTRVAHVCNEKDFWNVKFL